MKNLHIDTNKKEWYSDCMSKDDEIFHVMTLTPKQQAAIRMMLYNLYYGFVKKTMGDLKGKLKDPDIGRIIITKTNMILENFAKYEEFCEVLITRRQTMKSDKKLLTFSPHAMKNIQIALHGFDRNNCFLTPNDASYVVEELRKLSELIQSSANFTYSVDEIRREGGK